MGGFGGPSPAMSMPSPMQSDGRGIAGADATVGVSVRLRFIRLTYLHLMGAILLFAGLEYALFKVKFLYEKVSWPLTKFALGLTEVEPGVYARVDESYRWKWAVVLGAMMAISMLTHWMAKHTKSKVLHYIGLVLYTCAEAAIFVPLLMIVQAYTSAMIATGSGDPNIIRDAAIVTLGIFGALTVSVFVTKKDFSFLRSTLVVMGAASMLLIGLSLAFGFNLGIVFAIAMVVFCVGQILYETSQIMAHHDPADHVGASLLLFSSIMLLFWYVIQILMKLRQ